MKTSFRKTPLYSILCVSQIMVTLVLILAYSDSRHISMIYGILIFSFCNSIFIFSTKRTTLSKIVLIPESISWECLRKTILKLEWSEIETVKIEKKGIGYYCLLSSIENKNKNISKTLSFGITNRKLKKMYLVCSNYNVKQKINDILHSKWWEDNRN